ncbi:hypothetical protein ACJMK2_025477 [Sinanodonta woodiana]|uniref:Chitin-binding type-4 domain-containing protein n=1 Tax=Sinanodonta woodiana TaxID=1069815 RepID=A0ABD3XGL2_SINWO
MEKKNVFFWRIKSLTLNLVLVLAIKLPGCTGQGRMIEPPMRSSMWRYGFNTPNNYQDDFLHCGGYQRYLANNESCGTCGDPYDGVRHNEAGGQYATGIVGRYFSLSDTHIPVTIELTGSYGGKFEFRLCPHNSVNEPVSQMCLDRYPLLIEEGVSQGTPYSFEPKISGTYNLTVQIPDGMFCTQCVLQWKYRAVALVLNNVTFMTMMMTVVVVGVMTFLTVFIIMIHS